MSHKSETIKVGQNLELHDRNKMESPTAIIQTMRSQVLNSLLKEQR